MPAATSREFFGSPQRSPNAADLEPPVDDRWVPTSTARASSGAIPIYNTGSVGLTHRSRMRLRQSTPLSDAQTAASSPEQPPAPDC